VRQLQVLLDVKPTGVYNQDTEARVRGVQRVNELPVSGVVGLETAQLIDPGPWEVEAASHDGLSNTAV
jgi:hypothetical protein